MRLVGPQQDCGRSVEVPPNKGMERTSRNRTLLAFERMSPNCSTAHARSHAVDDSARHGRGSCGAR